MKKRFRLLTQVEKQAKARRDSAKAKFPLVFGLLASFGLAAIFFGFNELIRKISLFINNPWIIFLMGVGLLLATGAAYKKLN